MYICLSGGVDSRLQGTRCRDRNATSRCFCHPASCIVQSVVARRLWRYRQHHLSSIHPILFTNFPPLSSLSNDPDYDFRKQVKNALDNNVVLRLDNIINLFQAPQKNRPHVGQFTHFWFNNKYIWFGSTDGEGPRKILYSSSCTSFPQSVE